MTTKFVNTLTRGFCEIGHPDVAVCVLPGTEMRFAKDAEYFHPIWRFVPGLLIRQKAGKLARFRQINSGNPEMHHDAVEFSDGKILLLTHLCPGQYATVLQLPSSLDRKAWDRKAWDRKAWDRKAWDRKAWDQKAWQGQSRARSV